MRGLRNGASLNVRGAPASLRKLLRQAMSLDHRNDLAAFWLPFTQNRAFRRAPRILARAQGMHFYDESGRALLDGCSGLWCVNAGHGRKPIVEAIARAAGELDFAAAFP